MKFFQEMFAPCFSQENKVSNKTADWSSKPPNSQHRPHGPAGISKSLPVDIVCTNFASKESFQLWDVFLAWLEDMLSGGDLFLP